MLHPGLTHTSELTVADADTAVSIGSGDLPVLATPRMLALMENAAMLAVAPELDPADTTVGGFIDATHLRPTPVGAAVRATATLTGIDGSRLTFDVEAYAGDTLIGRGTHTRFIVNRDRFIGRLG